MTRRPSSSALREGRSGLHAVPEYAERGLRSQVAGVPQIDLEAAIDRKLKRFMGDAAAYASCRCAMRSPTLACPTTQVRDPRTGVIAGSGGGSAQWQIETGDLLREKGVRRVGPYMVPRTMCSTVSAALATSFGIQGVSYSISAACATSAHCIGAAADLIRHGVQDIVFAGGGEELHWGMTSQFDAMGALSTHHNDTPRTRLAPVRRRPRRLRHRRRRRHAGAGGLRTRAARVARASTPNWSATASPPMAPTWSRRTARARCAACRWRWPGSTGRAGRRPIDYLNTHGTSTPLGDVVELEAVRAVFGDAVPPLSSTKALTGHSLGAASVHEAIYSLLMLQDGFMAGSANIEAARSARRGLPDPARDARSAAARR